MNRKELIGAIAESTDITKAKAEEALKAFEVIVSDQLAAGGEVSLVGFGTFGTRNRPEKEGRNPQTGEAITIKAGRVPFFKPGKPLKEACNN